MLTVLAISCGIKRMSGADNGAYNHRQRRQRLRRHSERGRCSSVWACRAQPAPTAAAPIPTPRTQRRGSTAAHNLRRLILTWVQAMNKGHFSNATVT